MSQVKLWDLPVRLIHWSFVLLMPALWWTWRDGRMDMHRLLGYLALGLLLFRILWGFFGSDTARFSRFVKGPKTVLAYLRGRSGEPVVGHNPLGGWSVLLLLGLLSALSLTGLFTQDIDGLESGPLTPHVSYETAEAMRGWHDLAFDLLLAAIALHVAAILFYLLVRRDDLIGPMVSGRKTFGADVPPLKFAPVWRAFLLAAVSAAITYWISRGVI